MYSLDKWVSCCVVDNWTCPHLWETLALHLFGARGCFFHALRAGGATNSSVAHLRTLLRCPEPGEAEEEHVMMAIERFNLLLVAIPAEMTVRPVRLNHDGVWEC